MLSPGIGRTEGATYARGKRIHNKQARKKCFKPKSQMGTQQKGRKALQPNKVRPSPGEGRTEGATHAWGKGQEKIKR